MRGASFRVRKFLRGRFPVRALAASALLAGLVISVPAAQAAPSPAPPAVLDGPSPNIVGVSGMDVARDGTGGLVYVKEVGGVAHVFVSQLAGSFQPPHRIDSGLSGPSSQPVIAAGNGGLLLIAFINGGQLYVVDRGSLLSGYTAPVPLAGGASNPAIAITNLGKAYLAYTTLGTGGHDVRCAYYYQGIWGVEPGVLDAIPGDNAGAGTGRPAATASGDGVGIVAWGEAGHIYLRRIWGIPPSGTGPSIAYEQADVPSLGGWGESSSADPVLATGGNSSYAAVAFQETFSNGSQQQSRVLMQQLQADNFSGLIQPDGLSTPGPEGADQPQIEAGEYGQGWVTSEHQSSHQLFGMLMGNNESPGPVMQIDSNANYGAPDAFSAPAGLHSSLIAWQETPFSGASEIRARFYDGTSLGGEEVLSSPNMGPTDAAAGLVAAGDSAADVAVAWAQGTPGLGIDRHRPALPGAGRVQGRVEVRLRAERRADPVVEARQGVMGPGAVPGDGGRDQGRPDHGDVGSGAASARTGPPWLVGEGRQSGRADQQLGDGDRVRGHDPAQGPRQAERRAQGRGEDPSPGHRQGQRRGTQARGLRGQDHQNQVGRR